MKQEKVAIKRNKKEYMDAMRAMYNDVSKFADSGILGKMVNEIEESINKSFKSDEIYEIYSNYCSVIGYRNAIFKAIGK